MKIDEKGKNKRKEKGKREREEKHLFGNVCKVVNFRIKKNKSITYIKFDEEASRRVRDGNILDF